MDIFEKDLSGAMVSPDEPGYDKLISAIFDTMATAAEMNAKGWPRTRCGSASGQLFCQECASATAPLSAPTA